ncbi:unnamed protein product [Rotaria magnacalcarata]|uniref:RING-type domain-containing protein n=2 Tax=Rotaria magnacalcarata TaxID=392030 RepID=A0A815HYH9_9BILA|nr:unnamed protein product [Rotaria magnacalcarata]
MNTLIHFDYEYINEDEIDDELKCGICKQPFESPVSLRICNHTFCKVCIKIWLSQNQTCPICRHVARHHFGPDNQSHEKSPYVPINTKIVLNQLDRLLVRCLLCQEINIQRCHWKNHEKRCSRRIVTCPSVDIQCPWKGPRDKLSIHLNHCTYQQMRPLIDEVKNELILTRKKQMELKTKINLLERKVTFLCKFINRGNIMSLNCKKPEVKCKYNSNDGFDQTHQVICNLCNRYIFSKEILLHDCQGGCICCYCVHSQYSDHLKKCERSKEPVD